MASFLIFTVVVIGAFAIGHFSQAAKEAHDRFSSYKGRVIPNFMIWVKDTTRVVLIVIGVLLAVYVLLRWG